VHWTDLAALLQIMSGWAMFELLSKLSSIAQWFLIFLILYPKLQLQQFINRI
jgi:hypothetical protein